MQAALVLLLSAAVATALPTIRHRGMSGVPFVINGEDVAVGEFPWQCALMVYGSSFSCGCSIMDDSHIMIAAHCTDSWNPSDIEILVGAHDLYTQSEGEPTYMAVTDIAIHPDYSYDSSGVPRYDVSIVTVETITFTDLIQAVPSRANGGDGDVYAGQECYITGWGDASAGGSQMPDVMQKAQVRVLELADCQARYSSTPYTVYGESICVYKLNDGDDHTASCYGDSGGPVVCRESPDADFVQAGITSWGYPPCGVDGSADGLPSVYMAIGDASVDDFFDQFVAN